MGRYSAGQVSRKIGYRLGVLSLLVILLASCTAAPEPQITADPTEPQDELPAAETQEPEMSAPDLPDLGEAPELENDVWLNVDGPLRLAGLRGKVVLLEMWTFGCINCRNVIPSLQEWHENYHDQGLVIIGNHYPEFAFEEDLDNLKEAVERLEIEYAVAQDNEGSTWRAYQNRFWPTLYLIDKQGRLRYRHIGEGAYAETEGAIQALLAEESSMQTEN
jgi:thiol-disulfide isomerase/thioredoxin